MLLICVFDQDIASWDVSNVIAMNSMFAETALNQDLSSWCVTNITSSPSDFDRGTPVWTLPKPVWGTCPD
ncbi:BspA family leucine-rich repeat surface protein [Flavobacteriaceae bacterium]|nr:BspA family leucine-rich repeat surface protein [Flavobacteriaceae bacterium]